MRFKNPTKTTGPAQSETAACGSFQAAISNSISAARTAIFAIAISAAVIFSASAVCPGISMVVPCYAQDGPGTPSLEDNMKETLGNQYAVKGNYAISFETGDIFFSEDSQTFFSSGVGSDGCVYDENGKQENTLSYVRDKYIGQFESADENGPGSLITFDTKNELNLFLTWFQLEHMDHQGDLWSFTEKTELGGKKQFQIMKSSFENKASEPSEAYYAVVNEIADKVKAGSQLVDSMSAYAQVQVAQYMTYDSAYRNETMDKAVSDRKGVCYHYAKMMKDVLDACGIQSEIICGEVINDGVDDSHVWLKVWDSDNNKWIYRDPTRASMSLSSGLFSVDIYDIYAGSYRQVGLTKLVGYKRIG